MSRPPIIEEFIPVIRNTLRGFARVRMPSGTIYHDIGIHQQGAASWAIPASKPRLDRANQQMRDATGKLLWSPLVSFETRELRERFSSSIIEALREAHPRALDAVPAETEPEAALSWNQGR
jgi:hypothetical protein